MKLQHLTEQNAQLKQLTITRSSKPITTAFFNASITLVISELYQLITSSACVRHRIGTFSEVNTILGNIWCSSETKYKYRLLDTINDTVDYVVKLIRNYSRIPYKSDLDAGISTARTLTMKSNDASARRVRSTYTEQYICYLMQIPGLSEDRVTAIANKYPTFKSLYSAYENCTNDTQRNNLVAVCAMYPLICIVYQDIYINLFGNYNILQDVKVSNRRIGVLSERLCRAVYSKQTDECAI